MRFSPDGKLLASAAGKLGFLFNADDGKQMLTLTGYKTRINSLAFSSDSKRVVAGGNDSTVRVWDLESKKGIHYLGHTDSVTAVAFHPDGQRLISGGNDHTARVWHLQLSQKTFKLPSALRHAAFSADGRWVAAPCSDESVRVWDMATGKQTHVFEGHVGEVGLVKFSADGRRLYSATGVAPTAR
ncbi:MAG: WD40 repeat domain-containing protein [Planctomycetes bacterium]|nr:WD40 repeat domain-containing protein [Planctomycetota bacterium]